jgi:antiphage defense system Thoeris ThsB-like protein
MDTNITRKHVFISHHHKDDESVTSVTRLLASRHYELRNSSIRAKLANQRRLDQGIVRDEVIRRLLRRKISWASTVVVLIGKDTHSRSWVNWEIDEANRQGKRIVGVFVRGGTDAHIPPSLEKYASAIVAWNTESIMNAIEAGENIFQEPDGSASPVNTGAARSQC